MDDDPDEEIEEDYVEVEVNVFGSSAAVAWAQFESLCDHGFSPPQAIYLIASNMGGDLTAPMM